MADYQHLGNVTLWGNVCISKTDETRKVEEWQDIKLCVAIHTRHDRWLPVLWPEIEAIARKHNWHGIEGKVGTLYTEPYHSTSLLDYLVRLSAIQDEINAMVERYEQVLHDSSVLAKIRELTQPVEGK